MKSVGLDPVGWPYGDMVFDILPKEAPLGALDGGLLIGWFGAAFEANAPVGWPDNGPLEECAGNGAFDRNDALFDWLDGTAVCWLLRVLAPV